MKYKITITFKHFDSKPIIVESDATPSTEYDISRRASIYSCGYPPAFQVATEDVLLIQVEENKNI